MRVVLVVSCLLAAAAFASATYTPIPSVCAQVPGVVCSKTIGFWGANPHLETLQAALTSTEPGNMPPVAAAGAAIMLGSHIAVTTTAQALYVLNKGGNADNAVLNMMAQLLAALLNQKMGSWVPTTLPSDGSSLCQIENDALAWLDAHVTTVPTGWSAPATGMHTATSTFFDGIDASSLNPGWATALDHYNNFGEGSETAEQCWDGVDPVTLPPEDSCVDLPHGFECDKPHDDLTGPCLEVVTSTSSFRATGDHLIHTPEQGWRLVRELKLGDVLRSGLVESVTETVCKSLNSCQTEDRRFEAYGEVFAQNALITPDNYLTMLIHDH